jgi:hypothetical protein
MVHTDLPITITITNVFLVFKLLVFSVMCHLGFYFRFRFRLDVLRSTFYILRLFYYPSVLYSS